MILGKKVGFKVLEVFRTNLPIFWHIVMNIFKNILRVVLFSRIPTCILSLYTITMMDSPVNTPVRRKRGAEVALSHRHAMAVAVALAIPTGNSRVPKSILGPLTERYDFRLEYPTKLWKN